jgi:hypothetical protein
LKEIAMYIVGSLEYSISLELALKDIQNKGIENKNILCIPLEKKISTEKFYDTIHRTDGKNTMGVPFFIGTCFSLLGAIYGFLLKWGPIIWGGISFLIGISIGIIVNFIVYKKKVKNKKDNLSEVIVIINCEDNKEDDVVKILWEQYALGVGKFYK